MTAHGMPRLDVLRAARRARGGYRSGFWGIARVRRGPGRRESCWRCARRSSDGADASRRALGRIPIARRDGAGPRRGGRAERRDLHGDLRPAARTCCAASSTRSARRRITDWVCVDLRRRSSPGALRGAARRAVAGDPRFVVSRSPRRLGLLRELRARAGARAARRRRFVALADQDDAWHPDKLATLLAALGDARLVYSDARLVDAGRRRCSRETYWSRRAQQPRRTCGRCWSPTR